MSNKYGAIEGIYALLAMIDGATNEQTKRKKSFHDVTPAEIHGKKDYYNHKILKRRGVKSFEIDGRIIWARDERNAIRKAKLTSQNTIEG